MRYKIIHLHTTNLLSIIEIVVRLQGTPDHIITLKEAFSKDGLQCAIALTTAICNSILPTPLLPLSLFSPSMNLLKTQEANFRQVLEKAKFPNLSDKEKMVLEAAYDSRYDKDHLEGAFYNHGGYTGIIALILFMRTGRIEKGWPMLPIGCHIWLIKWVVSTIILADIQE